VFINVLFVAMLSTVVGCRVNQTCCPVAVAEGLILWAVGTKHSWLHHGTGNTTLEHSSRMPADTRGAF
jgi:hypothetical protein